MKPRWKQYLLYASLIIIGVLLIIFLMQPVFNNNLGFDDKTLWDRMELLVIPLALAVGAFYLERSERNTEREIARDRQQETALQTYLDRITELMLEKELLTTEDKKVRDAARIRTLSVLRGLDGKRKGIVVLFLAEAGLINWQQNAVIDLRGADLTGVNLSGELIDRARISSADLSRANFKETIFDGCDFTGSKLVSANLQGCDLAGDNGPGLPSILVQVDLTFANLADALVWNETLQKTKSLKGAIMPDGTIHE